MRKNKHIFDLGQLKFGSLNVYAYICPLMVAKDGLVLLFIAYFI